MRKQTKVILVSAISDAINICVNILLHTIILLLVWNYLVCSMFGTDSMSVIKAAGLVVLINFIIRLRIKW